MRNKKTQRVKKPLQKPMNCLIYNRVSTEEQAKKGYSLDAQEDECKKFALLEGYNVIKIFREEGKTAKNTNRIEFQKMLKYCKEHKNEISCVIFWKYERFMRMLKDQLNTIDYLEELGIEVMSVTEPNSKGSAGNLTRNILGALAQYENEVKSERVLSGMKKAFKLGKWLWRPPFGYKKNTELRNIEPDGKNSEIVKQIFQKFSTGLYSQTDILNDLKKRGIKLSPTHLCEILRNQVYCGILYKPEWSPEQVRGTYKKIVSEELFNKVQDILNGRKPIIAPHDFENEDYPLKQFLICPHCGKTLTGSNSISQRGKKLYQYYACYNNECPSKNKEVRKSKFSIAKEKAEKDFVDVLHSVTPQTETINLFKSVVKDVYLEQTHEEKTLHINLQLELDKLLENKKRLVDFYLEDKIDTDTYELKLSDFAKREQDLKCSMSESSLSSLNFEEILQNSLTVIQNIANAWYSGDFRIKKNIQNLLFPNGLRADFQSFQNSLNSTIFKQIGTLSVPYIDKLPPSEFESLSTP